MLEGCYFIKTESGTGAFFEHCEIFKNIYFVKVWEGNVYFANVCKHLKSEFFPLNFRLLLITEQKTL